MDARDAGLAGGDGMASLGKELGAQVGGIAQERLQLGDEDLAQETALVLEAIRGGEVQELDRLQLGGQRDGDGVGVDPVGLAVAIEAERRDDGDDSLRQKALEHLGVDALDLAGELVVDAADDSEGVGDDGVGGDGAEVVGGEALEDLVREPIGRGERDLQRAGVGDAGAVEVGGRDATLGRKRRHLARGAMHEHDADVQRPEDGDVEEKVGKVVVGDDGAVDGDHEGLLPEPRDVAEDAAKVCRLHGVCGGFVPAARMASW